MGLGCSTTTTTLMSLVALVLVVSRPSPVASAVVCREAVAKLLPCELFLVGLGGATPSLACCSGARDLDKMAADSPSDKKDLCQCLKQAAQSFPINFARANQLTSLCGLTTTITFSPSVDCDKL